MSEFENKFENVDGMFKTLSISKNGQTIAQMIETSYYNDKELYNYIVNKLQDIFLSDYYYYRIIKNVKSKEILCNIYKSGDSDAPHKLSLYRHAMNMIISEITENPVGSNILHYLIFSENFEMFKKIFHKFKNTFIYLESDEFETLFDFNNEIFKLIIPFVENYRKAVWIFYDLIYSRSSSDYSKIIILFDLIKKNNVTVEIDSEYKERIFQTVKYGYDFDKRIIFNDAEEYTVIIKNCLYAMKEATKKILCDKLDNDVIGIIHQYINI